MATDWVARGLGIAGAASGFLALAWNVISWRREGPVLKATATYVKDRRGDVKIAGHIANRGRLQTTITRLRISYIGYIGREESMLHRGLVTTEVRGVTLNQPMLPQTGSAYVISLTDAEDLRVSLNYRRYTIVRFYTATNQFTDAVVKFRS